MSSAGGNIIVLSPHLDDAAICVGGLLERLRCMSLLRHAEVVNIFTASIYVREGFEISPRDINEVSLCRSREDLSYFSRLGIKATSLGFPDSSAIGLSDDEECRVSPENDFRLPDVERVLAPLIATAKYLLCPLCIGRHIDHLITRHIVERKVDSSQTIIFYEDLPYSCYLPGAFNAEQTSLSLRNFDPLLIPIGDVGALKKQGLRCYPSQLDNNTIDKIIGFAASKGLGNPCERLLIKSQSRREFSDFLGLGLL